MQTNGFTKDIFTICETEVTDLGYKGKLIIAVSATPPPDSEAMGSSGHIPNRPTEFCSRDP